MDEDEYIIRMEHLWRACDYALHDERLNPVGVAWLRTIQAKITHGLGYQPAADTYEWMRPGAR